MQHLKYSSIHDIRYKEIISILIQARKDKGISQSTLAMALGFGQSDISKIETFERRLDIIEFLDFLNAISEGDAIFMQNIWIKVYECYSQSK